MNDGLPELSAAEEALSLIAAAAFIFAGAMVVLSIHGLTFTEALQLLGLI